MSRARPRSSKVGAFIGLVQAPSLSARLVGRVKLEVPDELAEIVRNLPGSYLVGGCVRDALLGRPVKDYDIEVFGVTYEDLAQTLRRWGKTDLVGKSFGVVKLTVSSGTIYDFSVPRRDSKVGSGHKGFQITFDAAISPKEAAARRDFTINSLMYDPRMHTVLDFFNGQEDLKNRVLRHTSAAFIEDPLRVLRGMQFCARFELTPAAETVTLCQTMKDLYPELAVERVRDEWFKWAARSRLPSAGLKFLRDTKWIDHFPELKAIIGVPQDPEWHPEGDVFTHTCHCCDALVKLPSWAEADEESRIVLSLGILTHDFGKAVTTEKAMRDGRERTISPGHEEAGAPLAESFCERIGVHRAITDRVLPLVRNHMAHMMTVTDRSVRRLSKRLEPESIEHLFILMTADASGRPPKPVCLPQPVLDLRAKAEELKVQERAPTPIIMGRHLFRFGLQPGPEFKILLDEAYEAQLEGRFSDLDGGLHWLREVKRLHPI
jgi:tRNA nucleotidyltransferase (CCA-adding enzyme)